MVMVADNEKHGDNPRGQPAISQGSHVIPERPVDDDVPPTTFDQLADDVPPGWPGQNIQTAVHPPSTISRWPVVATADGLAR